MNTKRVAKSSAGSLIGAVALSGILVSTAIAQEVAQQPAQVLDAEACVPNANEVCVNITFWQGCPTGVDRQPVIGENIGKKFIVWQAIDAGTRQPVNESFKIWFEPFNSGPPMESNNKGRKKSPSISNSAPATPVVDGEGGIDYKYTIEGLGCNEAASGLSKYHDPRFTVRR